jgi:hypothetical protein
MSTISGDEEGETIVPFKLTLSFDQKTTFRYSDPREELPEYQEQAKQEFVCSITITKPKTDTTEEIILMLTETRTDHDS